MLDYSTPIICIITFALFFDYTNGFHDTANAISTVVASKVMNPKAAVMMAAIFNFIGALTSTYVAKTIVNIVDPSQTSSIILLAAIIGATAWNLITWLMCLPSSSSHALIGGIYGASIIHNGYQSLNWQTLIHKVLIPMILVPFIGFVAGAIVISIIYLTCSKKKSGRINSFFSHLQILASAFKALAHGQSDAQKTMGLITAALIAAGIHKSSDIPTWVILSCATAIALGTACGGWRIIKTMATKIMKIDAVHGFAADTSATLVILISSLFGMPVSTSHVVAGSLFGVGTTRRTSGVRWQVGQNIAMAWIFTLPGAAVLSVIIYGFLYVIGIN